MIQKKKALKGELPRHSLNLVRKNSFELLQRLAFSIIYRDIWKYLKSKTTQFSGFKSDQEIVINVITLQ